MKKQICNKCDKERTIDDYRIVKKLLATGICKKYRKKVCKYCERDYRNIHRSKNLEHSRRMCREWRENNKEHIKAYDKQYNLDNRELRKSWKKAWDKKNKEYIKLKAKEWYSKNKEYSKSKSKQWYLEHKEYCIVRAKSYRDSLSDAYIASRIIMRYNITKEEILKYPELIEANRLLIKMQRL